MAKARFSTAQRIFRELIRDFRQSKNLTQSEVARLLGVPQSFVSKYETGERRLDFVETAMVCEVLGLTIVELARAYEEKFKHAHAKSRK